MRAKLTIVYFYCCYEFVDFHTNGHLNHSPAKPLRGVLAIRPTCTQTLNKSKINHLVSLEQSIEKVVVYVEKHILQLGCCNRKTVGGTVFRFSQTFLQLGFHITRLLQTFFGSPKRNDMFSLIQARFSQLHSPNEF